MHIVLKIILTIILFIPGILSLGLWPYIPDNFILSGVFTSILISSVFMYPIYLIWRTNTTGTAWMNLDKVKITFNEEKWYNNNWIIALCFLLWPLGLFLTIRKILIHYGYYNMETKRFQKSNKQEKKSKNESLEKLRRLEIISESEYRSKKENLNKQQKKTEMVDALIKAKADGLLTDEEYQIKLKSLEGNTEP